MAVLLYSSILLCATVFHTQAQAISITVGDISCTSTAIGSTIQVLLTKDPFTCGSSLEYDISDDSFLALFDTTPNATLYYSLSINEEIVDTGAVMFDESEGLPSSVDSNEIEIDETGDMELVMHVSFDEEFTNMDETFSGYGALFSITGFTTMVPLIFVVFFAVALKNVYVSLYLGVWIGSFIISGCSFRFGFEMSLGTYLLGSAASEDHQFVILFTVFLSGLVFLIQRSGGTKGFASVVVKLAKTGKLCQWACFFAGLLLFFDDYANALVVGTTFQPLTDMYHISREKLAFLVDATSAPDASIVPLSSWIGFELQQIQQQLDIIKDNNGGAMPEGLTDNAFVFFVVTIPTRFYPIYMLVFQIIIMGLSIEFGPMLIAERFCRVNKRADGGPGRQQRGTDKKVNNNGDGIDEDELHNGAEPDKDTPGRWWNMLVPILMLIALILGVIINSGAEGVEADGEEMSARNIFAYSDPWGSLLYGTFGASIFAMAMFMIQFKSKDKDGEPKMVPPSLPALKKCFTKTKKKSDNESDNDETAEISDGIPVPLMRFPDAIETWVNGIAFMSPAVCILILVWAIGAIMTDIGADRYFTRIISEDVNPENLPTLVFILAALLSAATGTSWGTMTILFPMVSPATWAICEGLDNGVFIYTVTLSQILSGSIFGDHSSPLSDTTLLSSVASGCDLFRHVNTQLPYALWVAFFSIVCGTVMIGNGTQAGVVLFVGILVQTICTWLVGAPVLAESGRFDVFTELYILCLDKCKCCRSKKAMAEQEREEQALVAMKRQTIAFVKTEQKSDMDLLMKFLELTKLIGVFQKCGFMLPIDDATMQSYSAVNVVSPANTNIKEQVETNVVEEDDLL